MQKKEFEKLKIFGLEILLHILGDLNELSKFIEKSEERERNITQTCVALGLFALKVQKKEIFIDPNYKRILTNFTELVKNGKNGIKESIKCPSCKFIQFPDVEYFILSFYKCQKCQKIIDKTEWNERNLCKKCKKQIDVVTNECKYCGDLKKN